MTDPRDGTMQSVTGPLPPAQAATFDSCPADWQDAPWFGVHEMILRALKERGLVETRRLDGKFRQWRRSPTPRRA
jgi:hypothetical protein